MAATGAREGLHDGDTLRLIDKEPQHVASLSLVALSL